MFWNGLLIFILVLFPLWTLNMKCFEMAKQAVSENETVKWTLNMKCFEIEAIIEKTTNPHSWTLNMKCFEISNPKPSNKPLTMNLKHEMFWNFAKMLLPQNVLKMNLKHEMFWNKLTWGSFILTTPMNLKHEMFWNIYRTCI